MNHKNINNIIYDVGPATIYLSAWGEEIKIICNPKWQEDLLQIFEVAKIAWNIDSEFSINPGEIIIKLNYNILKHYVEHLIVLFDDL